MKTSTSRRYWLRRAGRWMCGVALAAMAGHLLRRSGSVRETACPDASARLSCRQCTQLNACGLPRALSVKRFLKQQNESNKS